MAPTTGMGGKTGWATVLLLAFAMQAGTIRGEGDGAPDAREVAREQVRAARIHYDLGRFEQALEAYAAAYELDPVPALLFNIAQCHRGLGAHERALFFYEGYLRAAPDAPNRAVVEELIAESLAETARAAAAAEREPEPEDPEPAGPEEGSAVASPEQDEGTRGAVADAADPPEDGALGPAEPEPRPLYRRWWLWTVVGVAVAAVAAGSIAWAVADGGGTSGPSTSLGTVDWR